MKRNNVDLQASIETAIKLRTEIEKAYRLACSENPILAVLLSDLLEPVAKVKNRLQEIDSLLQ